MNDAAQSISPLYPQPEREQPLRIGLLLEKPVAPMWIAHIIESIQSSNFAELALVVFYGSPPAPSRLQRLLYDAYFHSEIALHRGVDSPFLIRDINYLLKDTQCLHGGSERNGAEVKLPTDDIASIRAEHLDVLLRFDAGGEVGPELLASARHGVWTYGHELGTDQGSVELLEEILRSEPVSVTELWRLEPEPDRAQVLYRSFGATHPHSLELGGHAACWKASNFVMRRLRQLARDGEVQAAETHGIGKRSREPGNLRMGWFLIRQLNHKAGALIRNQLGIQHWSIAWRRGQMDPDSPDSENMRTLPCPHGHFYADPFLFRHRGADWLFLEDYDYAARRGGIVAVPWSAQGPAGPAQPVLGIAEEHLSYPCVFAWQGEVYMVPEVGETGGPVRLFRAHRFPDQWEFACDLLTGHRAVDATLHEHAGRWYMFVNICETGGSENDELFLFYADTPFGPFQPHPQNPIVSDVRKSRPAGRLFTRGERLIRPSQDCAAGYGDALVFNEVLELTPSRYSERTLGRLSPTSTLGYSGCHTYAHLDGLEVIDRKQTRLRASVGA